MKLIRFMSTQEMRKYLDGEVLENHTNWSREARTESKGFCFFPADPDPESRLNYLSGLVSFDVVAEFEMLEETALKVSKGRYRDPDEMLTDLCDMLMKPVKSMEVLEYSMESYSKDTLKLVRMGTVVMKNKDWTILWDCDVFAEAKRRSMRNLHMLFGITSALLSRLPDDDIGYLGWMKK